MKPTFETVLEELGRALARAAQAEAEVVELRRVLQEIGAPYACIVREALSSPSPRAQALGRVVALVEDAAGCECEYGVPCCEYEHGPTANCWPCRARLALGDYEAARSGREEGEPTPEPDALGEEGNH